MHVVAKWRMVINANRRGVIVFMFIKWMHCEEAQSTHEDLRTIPMGMRMPSLLRWIVVQIPINWSRLPELNRRPSNYESDALQTELSRLRRELNGARRQLHYTNGVFGVSSGINRTNGRDVMTKDATKNVDRYKIRGGQINEF